MASLFDLVSEPDPVEEALLPVTSTVARFGRLTFHHADCREVLAGLASDSLDACVTDPPYALDSIVKRFGGKNAAPNKHGRDGAFARLSKNFEGKDWDTGEVAFSVAFWTEVLRVLKPGAHLVAFGGTKKFHHLAMAIEDAGFEIRDQFIWAYSTGQLKSHPVKGHEDWGTAVKPAFEPICVARKALDGTVAATFDRWGTGALNIGGSKVAGRCPPNILHDGSDVVRVALGSYEGFPGFPYDGLEKIFHHPKAKVHDRAAGDHPTVKPVQLLRWLIALVCPPGGTVLDPFSGSGTTGQAALDSGFSAILAEREEEYADIIRGRFQGDVRFSEA